MKIPEWRPTPPHMRGDDSGSRVFFGALVLIGSVVLIVVSIGLVLVGLLAR